MKILCVAEKPSIAKSISEILSSGNGLQNRSGKDKFCRNYCFRYRMPPGLSFGRCRADGWVDMVVTSVRGHLMSNDFGDEYRRWKSCSPATLFDAPILSYVSDDCKKVAQNLKEEARSADVLMIWTDCDREGEHIGAEIVHECQKVKRSIEVTRAKFSAIIANQIHHAAQNPVALDWAAANAVEARIELDLRIGSAFTRMQTLTLQGRFHELDKKIISYGPCQFPTLGFVVDQYIKHSEFVPEPFWYIHVMHRKARIEVTFHWARKHLFVRNEVKAIFDRCKSSPEASVVKVTSKQTRKFKPRPLTTVELQKSGGRLLHMAPKRILDVAEKLYQRGFLSYPRTETDQFDAQFDFKTLIEKQRNNVDWGSFASQLLDGQGAFDRPRNGQKNDKAHPPIHPTAHANGLTGDDKVVYEYVVRRFLAGCSKDAVGEETKVEIRIAGELFTASGIVVQMRNFLDVFPYENWGGPGLPEFQEGEHFVPTELTMKEGETTRPKLLTEADLVSLMDRNGIGTDATIAEHISKIIEREYVMAQMEGRVKYLVPSTLGMGLVMGYNDINFEGNKSLCKPLLRRETEEAMTKVCEGETTKAQMVQCSLQEYRAVYMQANGSIERVIMQMAKYLRGEEAPPTTAWEATTAVADRPLSTTSAPPQTVSSTLDVEDDEFDLIDDERLLSAFENSDIVGGLIDEQNSDSLDMHRAVPPSINNQNSATLAPRISRSSAPIEIIEIDDDEDDKQSLHAAPHRPSTDLSLQPVQTQTRITGAPLEPLSSATSTRNYQGVDTGDAIFPKCHCGQPAMQRKVVKESANKGRTFWKCSKGQGDESNCSFFEWCDEAAGLESDARLSTHLQVSHDSDTRRVRGIKDDSTIERYRSMMSSVDEPSPDDARCECGQEAKRNQVFKEGPNKGRHFFSCPKLSNRARCKFFQWEDASSRDEQPQQQQQSQRRSGGGSGRDDVSTGQVCFSCGKEGHWANSCPQPQPVHGTGEPSRGVLGVNAGRTEGNGRCFHCGEEGHWASNCPSARTSVAPTTSRLTRRIGPSTGNSLRTFEDVDVDDMDAWNDEEVEDERGRSINNSSTRANFSASSTGAGGATGKKRAGTCFNCGHEGHWSSECTEPRQEGRATRKGIASSRGRGAKRGRPASTTTTTTTARGSKNTRKRGRAQ